jgi:hypothetical protein
MFRDGVTAVVIQVKFEVVLRDSKGVSQDDHPADL